MTVLHFLKPRGQKIKAEHRIKYIYLKNDINNSKYSLNICPIALGQYSTIFKLHFHMLQKQKQGNGRLISKRYFLSF